MIEKITSLTNSKIKLAASLREKKYRDKSELFAGEGLRFSEMALLSDFEITDAYFTTDFVQNTRKKKLVEDLNEKIGVIFEVTDMIMKKISSTKSPQGIFLVIKKKKIFLDMIKNIKFAIALDGVKDPGNAGTIIRLADAVGAEALILTKNSADAYSDKVVRATMGSIFNIPVVEDVSTVELINFAKENKMPLYVGAAGEHCCYNEDFSKGGIFVFGNEAFGASEEILKEAKKIALPIFGKAESLNVASAASAILYEVVRQNKFKNVIPV